MNNDEKSEKQIRYEEFWKYVASALSKDKQELFLSKILKTDNTTNLTTSQYKQVKAKLTIIHGCKLK